MSAPRFFDDLFTALFQDVVNLDELPGNQQAIGRLVQRGIVDEKMLAPRTRIVGKRTPFAGRTQVF